MTSPPPARTDTMPSLTGLRAFALLFVYAGHAIALGCFASPSAAAHFSTATGDGRIAFLAVSFFFVLSGFVLTWSSKPGRTARSFWRRRLMRIGPVHVLIALVALAMFAAAGENIRWGPAVANLFLVQNWVPNQNLIEYQLNGASWSLDIELLCYLLFPLLVRFVSRLGTRALWCWGIGLGVAAILIPVLSYPLLSGYPPSLFYPAGSWPQLWALYFFPPVRAIEFILGMFLARLVMTGKWPNIGILPAVLVNLAVFLLLYHLPLTFGIAALYPIPSAMLIGAVATSDLKGRTTFLGGRFMVWLGDLSYPFYMLHLTAMFAIHAAFKREWAGYAHSYTVTQFSTPVAYSFIVGLLIVCVGLAWVLHKTVEMPAIRRWGRSTVVRAAPRTEPEPQLQL